MTDGAKADFIQIEKKQFLDADGTTEAYWICCFIFWINEIINSFIQKNSAGFFVQVKSINLYDTDWMNTEMKVWFCIFKGGETPWSNRLTDTVNNSDIGCSQPSILGLSSLSRNRQPRLSLISGSTNSSFQVFTKPVFWPGPLVYGELILVYIQFTHKCFIFISPYEVHFCVCIPPNAGMYMFGCWHFGTCCSVLRKSPCFLCLIQWSCKQRWIYPDTHQCLWVERAPAGTAEFLVFGIVSKCSLGSNSCFS